MADENWKTQFLILAIGNPSEPCTDGDTDALAEMMEALVPQLVFTKVRGRTADKLMVALMQERGVL